MNTTTNPNQMKSLSIKFNLLFIAICALFFSLNSFSQVQRITEGRSIIREHIRQYNEFNFFRDWSKIATFKSGVGETVDLFPIVYSSPDSKIELYGLQLDAEVKPQEGSIAVRNSGSTLSIINKNYIKRSIFIDKSDVAKMITYIQRDIIPNLKNTYKRKSKEYIFKSKEMFFSFLIYEKTTRITMHIIDYGPLGDGTGGGEQIEFWTESKVDEIPTFLETIKSFYSTMK
jgi:hypothetical protein